MKDTIDIEPIETRCCDLFTEALQDKAEAIFKVLKKAHDGKHSFSVTFNLKLVGFRVEIEGHLSHSTKDRFSFDGSVELDDPSNPKLPGFVEAPAPLWSSGQSEVETAPPPDETEEGEVTP